MRSRRSNFFDIFQPSALTEQHRTSGRAATAGPISRSLVGLGQDFNPRLPTFKVDTLTTRPLWWCTGVQYWAFYGINIVVLPQQLLTFIPQHVHRTVTLLYHSRLTAQSSHSCVIQKVLIKSYSSQIPL